MRSESLWRYFIPTSTGLSHKLLNTFGTKSGKHIIISNLFKLTAIAKKHTARMLHTHACLVLLVCWYLTVRVQGSRALAAENAATTAQQWGNRDSNQGALGGWGGLGGRSSSSQPALQQQSWLQQAAQQPSSGGGSGWMGSGVPSNPSTTSSSGGLGGLGSGANNNNNNRGGGGLGSGGFGRRGYNNNGNGGGSGSWFGGRPQQVAPLPAPAPAPIDLSGPEATPLPAPAATSAPQQPGGGSGGSNGGRWGGVGSWGSNNGNNGWGGLGGRNGWGGRGNNNNNNNNNNDANSDAVNSGSGGSGGSSGNTGSSEEQQPVTPAVITPGNSGSSPRQSPGWGGITNGWGQNNNNNGRNSMSNPGQNTPGQGGFGGTAIGRQGDRAALAPVIGDVAQYGRISRRNIPLTGTASTLAEGIRRRGNAATAAQGLTQAFDRGQGDAAAQAVAGAVALGGDSAAIGEAVAEATYKKPKAGSFLLRKSAELAVNNGQVQGFSKTMSNAFVFAKQSRYIPQFTNAVAEAISTGGAPARYAYGSAIATAIAQGGDSQAAIAEATAEAFCEGGSVAQSWSSAYAVALSQDSRGCLVLNEARALAVAKCGNGVAESFSRAQATSTVLGFCGLFSWLPGLNTGWSGSNAGSTSAGNGWANSGGQGMTGYNNGYWGK